MKPGDVVLIPVPQVSGRGRKLRPVVILAALPGPLQDILVCSVSADAAAVVQGWDELISEDAPGFKDTGLHATSVVRLSYINALNSTDVRGVVGSIGTERLEAIRARLRRILSDAEDE